jgi:hypothetical protein
MRAVIVFDSMFGNTHGIAEAVAEGLVERAQVDLFTVDNAPEKLDSDVDLLVVGGPTHGHGLSNRTSRQVSQKQARQGAVPARIGLREWLAQLTRPPRLVAAASFDTRFRKPAWLTGSAARGAAKRLRQRGLVVVAPAESFFVDTATGPLCAGEADRARRWGEALGETVALSGPARSPSA